MSTLKKIAQEAGISIKSVSRILNRTDTAVRPKSVMLHKKVRAIARRYQYIPNSSARSMRSGRFRMAGLVSGSKFLPVRLVQGLQNRLGDHNMHLSFEEVMQKKEAKDPVLGPRILREKYVDGLLIFHHFDIPRSIRERIRELKIAAVWINVCARHDSVYADEFTLSTRLTAKLIEEGHQRIGFLLPNAARAEVLSGTSWHYSIHDRFRGYCHAMEDAGLRSTIFIPERKYEIDESVPYIDAILRNPERPTALFAFDLKCAMEVLSVALRLGLRIPEDLRVACFLGEDLPEKTLPLLIAPVPWFEIGMAAVDMLVTKIQEPERRLPSIRVAAKGITDWCTPTLAGAANTLPSGGHLEPL